MDGTDHREAHEAISAAMPSFVVDVLGRLRQRYPDLSFRVGTVRPDPTLKF